MLIVTLLIERTSNSALIWRQTLHGKICFKKRHGQLQFALFFWTTTKTCIIIDIAAQQSTMNERSNRVHAHARDPRKYPGNPIHAYTKHVMSKAECNHIFGINWSRHLVNHVIECFDNHKAGGKQSNFAITARYTITSTFTKDSKLNIRSINDGGGQPMMMILFYHRQLQRRLQLSLE